MKTDVCVCMKERQRKKEKGTEMDAREEIEVTCKAKVAEWKS